MTLPDGLFAVIPAKDPRLGKSRLAPLLDLAARQALNLSLARRTIGSCVQVFGAVRTIVVTDSAQMRAIADQAEARVFGEEPLAVTAGTHDALNQAICAGISLAQQLGAQGVAVVPTDLPLISPAALERALAALPAAPGCVLAADRRGSGTNLLAMRPGDARLVAFGEASLERHAALARSLGFEARIHHCDRFALDLDLPEDFLYLEECHPWPMYASTTSTPSGSRLASIRT